MKKILSFTLILLTLLSLCIGLTACGEDSDETADTKIENECTHQDLKKVAKIEATCTEDGIKKHYICKECKKLFSDESAQSETTLENVTVNAPGHIMEDGTCTECGLTESLGLSYVLSYDGNLGSNAYTVIGIGNCYNSHIVIPETYNGYPVTRIESNAFSYTYSISKVTLSKNIVSVGNDAFYGCSSLESVYIPESVNYIGSTVFKGTFSLTEINVSSSNKNYDCIDGALYNEGATNLICYPAGKSENEFTVPNTVTRIVNYAFYGSDLTGVTIGKNVNSIGEYAFASCEYLETITISTKLATVEYGAFAECVNLSAVVYKGSEENWNEIYFDAGNNLLLDANITFGKTNKPSNPDNDGDEVTDELAGMTPDELYEFCRAQLQTATSYYVENEQLITISYQGESMTATQTVVNKLNGDNIYVNIDSEMDSSVNMETWYIDGMMYVNMGGRKMKAVIDMDAFKEQYLGTSATESALIDIPESWFNDIQFEKEDEKWALVFVVSGQKYNEVYENTGLDVVDIVGDVTYKIYFNELGEILGAFTSFDMEMDGLDGYDVHCDTYSDITIGEYEITPPADADNYQLTQVDF